MAVELKPPVKRCQRQSSARKKSLVLNMDKIQTALREGKVSKGMPSPTSPVRSSVDLASIYLMRNMPDMRASFFVRAKKLLDPPQREV